MNTVYKSVNKERTTRNACENEKKYQYCEAPITYKIPIEFSRVEATCFLNQPKHFW